ncbi:uncharacterized protein At4g08330, chloroplastic-like [Hordeum vulgare subsp. vulgare]|nr:uncharacterized protein At4g08330, chloroplastic-like [Hordeum vulgare subsp. vulgare]
MAIYTTSVHLPFHTRRIRKQVKISSRIHPSMELDKRTDTPPSTLLPRTASTVTYCCGRCGYDLKLSSTARDTAGIVGAGAGGARRRRRWRGSAAAVVVFDAIDDARFGHLDEFRCLDLRARRLFARRTRLLCRKCGAHLGFGYDDNTAATRPPRYHIKIRALHPASSSDAAAATPPPSGAPAGPRP